MKLKKSEIEAISRVFPFWLDVWKHQAIEYLPNAYDWLYNKRWKEPLPNGYPTHIPADSAHAPNPTREPRERIKSAEPPQADRAEREEILRFFHENLSPEMREKIEAEADAKFAGSLVKKWDLLYSIEIAKLTKPHYPKK